MAPTVTVNPNFGYLPKHEKVVISGISGLYPEARSVQDLSNILYNKENPVTKENIRWSNIPREIGPYTGKAPDLEHFDAQFFKVHRRLGLKMDVMSRKLLEQVYQAIYDAGVNPCSLNGKKIAVITGITFSETEATGFFNNSSGGGLGIIGCSSTMFANRISYWLNLKGPSFAVNLACSSSLGALEMACAAIKNGECEAAIVGACFLCMLPESSVHYSRVNQITKDGKTKSFDQGANGCILSDAINAIYLQKSSDALRIYAEVVHVKNEHLIKHKEEKNNSNSGSYRTPNEIASFLKDFYREANLPPQVVEYVEGYGIGSPESDKSELEAFDEVFCKNRTDPLYVGSVMSNVGFSGSANGITAITKVLLGYQTGYFASNLHYNTPRQDIEAIRDGRIQVLSDHHRIKGQYAAVNSMSVTGINTHVLLKGNLKQKDLSKHKSSVPYLITISGRLEFSVTKILDDLKSRPIDPEELMLLHNFHTTSIPEHLNRGYAILNTNNTKTVALDEAVNYYDNAKRPLWFVYSGMGSQWAGMGTELMTIPIFAAAIERCHKALEPKGIDIVDIITTPDPNIFNNILNSFVGIAAIQIGLTDILYALDMTPDNLIGHSVGELGCAYADGCLTTEEMILAAYSRGRASLDTDLIKGAMAAVGIGYKQVASLCPPDVDVACHNGPDSCTISGPADTIAQFVSQLTAKGIFAKEVASSDIAYHSRYIADAGSTLLRLLKSVIKNPRPRSSRWLSTSVPQDNWDKPEAKYCSAEYQTNNLLNPVLFEETSMLIPGNAILIEIAPRGLLQAILKRSLSSSCYNLSLTKKGSNNILYFLQSIGKLYMEGCIPNLKALYPKIDLPVSAGTPMLSHLVEWMHSEKWYIPKASLKEKIYTNSCEYYISIHDEEYKYLKGNVIKGKIIFPVGGILMLVWDTFSMLMGHPKRKETVRFTDLYIDVLPILYEENLLKLFVTINKGNGKFEVTGNDSKVASGIIISIKNTVVPSERRDNILMNFGKQDVYKILGEKGYSYSEDFCSIMSTDSSATNATVEWCDNWATLIETALQLSILNKNYDGVLEVTYINNITIEAMVHKKYVFSKSGQLFLKAHLSNLDDTIRCGGLFMKHVQYREIPINPYPVTLLIPSKEDKNKIIELKELSQSQTKVTLKSLEIGNLESLCWVEDSESFDSGVLTKVHYASLSSSDFKKAAGSIQHGYNYNSYGMDFSGVSESGSRVMGIVRQGACRSYVRAHPDLLWPVPDHWTLEEAVTVPFAYAYAFYCFTIKARINFGMKVLIHEGAGALGQAAINIALAHKCEVFTTVGDIKTKHFLKKLYPQLKEEYIGNSRDATFSDIVLSATQRKGCDIIINNVENELKYISLQCGNLHGILLDIEQIPNRENFELRMDILDREKHYVTADFHSIFKSSNSEEVKYLQKLMHDGIKRGYVRPLAHVRYSSEEVPRAFRLLANNWHRGHVLLKLEDSTPLVRSMISCSTNCVQLIICDKEDFVVQLAKRLVSRGANIIYVWGPNFSPYFQHKINHFKSIGVSICISDKKIENGNDVVTLLSETLSTEPVEGIYVNDFVHIEVDVRVIVQNIEYHILSNKCNRILRYCGVITNNKIIAEQTNISKLNEKMTMSFIDISQLESHETSNAKLLKNKGAWNLSLIDALECGLSSAIPMLVANERKELFACQQLAKLIDLPSLEEADQNTSLEELTVGTEKITLVKEWLRKKYHKCLSEQAILELTKQEFQQLDPLYFEYKKGFNVYLSYIGEDEIISDFPMIFLPTLANMEAENLDNTFESDLLCIIPGIEGHHERYRSLCQRLKLPAVVLQPGLDINQDTISQSAQRYSQVLLDQIGIKNSFYLLGQDMGILIALELALILEEKGYFGVVFCLGSAPEDVRSILEQQLATFTTEGQLQLGILKTIFKLLVGEEPSHLDEILIHYSCWAERVDACIKLMTGRIVQTKQFVKALIQSFYARILNIKQYDSALPSLKSRIIVLRSPDTPVISSTSYSVANLSAPLGDAAEDVRCAAVINKNVSKEILEEFEKKNLCNLFVINFEQQYAKAT